MLGVQGVFDPLWTPTAVLMAAGQQRIVQEDTYVEPPGTCAQRVTPSEHSPEPQHSPSSPFSARALSLHR